MFHFKKTRALPALTLVLAGLVLASCDGDGIAQTDSVLHLDITDAPLTGATKVWLQFTGVEVKAADGAAQSIMFPSAKGFDLLTRGRV
jgi:hypothetical protein